MFKKVAFTMYPVTDPKRARSFYDETLDSEGNSIILHQRKTG